MDPKLTVLRNMCELELRKMPLDHLRFDTQLQLLTLMVLKLDTLCDILSRPQPVTSELTPVPVTKARPKSRKT